MADFVRGGGQGQRRPSDGDAGEQMHVAAAVAAVFEKRVSLGDQQVPARVALVRVQRLGQGLDRRRRRRAVVGRQGDVAFLGEQRRHLLGVGGAAFGFLPPQLRRGLSQPRARQSGFPRRGLGFRMGQRLVDDLAEIRPGRPAGDFLLENLDGVADRLFHALQVQPRIGRHSPRHLPDEPLGHIAFPPRLGRVVLDQQVHDPGVGDVAGEIGGVFELAIREPPHRLQPPQMRRLRRAGGVGGRPGGTARGGGLGFGGEEEFAVIQRQPRLPLGV